MWQAEVNVSMRRILVDWLIELYEELTLPIEVLHAAYCPLPTSHCMTLTMCCCTPPYHICSLMKSHFSFLNSQFSILSSQFLILNSQFSLLIAYCLLLTANCLLLIACCLLLAVHCLRLTACCSLLYVEPILLSGPAAHTSLRGPISFEVLLSVNYLIIFVFSLSHPAVLPVVHISRAHILSRHCSTADAQHS